MIAYWAVSPRHSLGHVARAIAICRHLPEAVIIVYPWHRDYVELEQLPVVAAANPTETLRAMRPDLLVVDHWPWCYGLHAASLTDFAFPKVLVHRSPVDGPLDHFDEVIDVEHRPLLMRDGHELHDRAQSRGYLGARGDRMVVLVPGQSSGAWLMPQIRDHFAPAADAVDMIVSNHFPLVELFHGADLVVGGAGKNLSDECVATGTPALLVPASPEQRGQAIAASERTLDYRNDAADVAAELARIATRTRRGHS